MTIEVWVCPSASGGLSSWLTRSRPAAEAAYTRLSPTLNTRTVSRVTTTPASVVPIAVREASRDACSKTAGLHATDGLADGLLVMQQSGDAGQRLDHDGAGELSGGMPTEAVGDRDRDGLVSEREDQGLRRLRADRAGRPGADEQAVLVVVAQQAVVAHCGDRDVERGSAIPRA